MSNDTDTSRPQWPTADLLPEGKAWVAAFRQPLPMGAAGRLCELVGDAYGSDAVLVAPPGSDWLFFAGTPVTNAPALPKRPTDPQTFRVSQTKPIDNEDGGELIAICAEQAARAFIGRHGEALDPAGSVWVWQTDPAAAVAFPVTPPAEPCACEGSERPTAEPQA